MLALLIEYDGTNYAGWQSQPNSITVQHALERAVQEVYGVNVPVVGSGRTDAGVHARGQVAHVDLPDTAHAIPESKIATALNSRLSHDVRICAARLLQAPFHARFSAISREYEYYISTTKSVFTRRFAWAPELPFDEHLLHKAATVFEGKHDFTTFSKHNPDTANYTCHVQECTVQREPIQMVGGVELLMVRIRADRFVYGMCRSIVGAMMSVARRRRTVEAITYALQARDRSLQEVLVPPQGLVLSRVQYPMGLFDDESDLPRSS